MTIVFGKQALFFREPQFADAVFLAQMQEYRKMHEKNTEQADK